MNKATFLYMLIEAVVFLVPIATLFIKYGKNEQRQEETLKAHAKEIEEQNNFNLVGTN